MTVKTTKTIEIDICDMCGSERRRVITCGLCKREMCDRCSGYAHVTVQGFQSHPRGTRTTSLRTKYNNLFCTICEPRVVTELEKLGLLEIEDTTVVATLD